MTVGYSKTFLINEAVFNDLHVHFEGWHVPLNFFRIGIMEAVLHRFEFIVRQASLKIGNCVVRTGADFLSTATEPQSA